MTLGTLTLSHCWGEAPVFRLLQSNFEELRRRVPFDKLSRSFQDAIAATRVLFDQYGIWHIWIDSLCIIQDSPHGMDWKKEAPCMGRVYKNSYCTLAGAFGVDGSSGLGLGADRRPTGHLLISVPWDGRAKLYVAESESGCENEILQLPFLRRAWVTQEYFMSPRVLFFKPGKLFWSCPGLPLASEKHPKGFCSFPGSDLPTVPLGSNIKGMASNELHVQ